MKTDATGRELKKGDFVSIRGFPLSGKVRRLESKYAAIKYPKRRALIYADYNDVFYYDLNAAVKRLTGQMP